MDNQSIRVTIFFPDQRFSEAEFSLLPKIVEIPNQDLYDRIAQVAFVHGVLMRRQGTSIHLVIPFSINNLGVRALDYIAAIDGYTKSGVKFDIVQRQVDHEFVIERS